MYGSVVLVALFATAMAGPVPFGSVIEINSEKVDGPDDILERRLNDIERRLDVLEGHREKHEEHNQLEKERSVQNEKTMYDFVGRIDVSFKETDGAVNVLRKDVDYLWKSMLDDSIQKWEILAEQERKLKGYHDELVALKLINEPKLRDLLNESHASASESVDQSLQNAQFSQSAAPEDEDINVNMIAKVRRGTFEKRDEPEPEMNAESDGSGSLLKSDEDDEDSADEDTLQKFQVSQSALEEDENFDEGGSVPFEEHDEPTEKKID